jgi:hypothetical protein
MVYTLRVPVCFAPLCYGNPLVCWRVSRVIARKALPPIDQHMPDTLSDAMIVLRVALAGRYDSLLSSFAVFASAHLGWLRHQAFGDIPATEARLLGRRFRDLALVFHPDRNSENLAHYLARFMALLAEER